MKVCPDKKIVYSCLTAFLSSTFALAAFADTTITVGNPDRDGGKVKWEVTGTDNTKVQIVIEVPGATTANGKARLLEKALIAKGFTVTRNGAAVKIKNAKKAEKFLDETHEKDKIAGLTPKTGTLDFHLFTDSALAGIDQDGLESQFQASLGFDGIFAEAVFNFSDLSGNTIDALLADTYNNLLADLPIIYQPNLSLDLGNDAIDFMFPSTASEGFVENFTSDVNAFSTASLSVPEPSMWGLFAVGAAGFGFIRKNRNSKKPTAASA